MLIQSTNRTDHLMMEEGHMDKLYSSTNLAVRWFFNYRLDVMARLLPCKPLKILDAGCGEGHLLKKLKTLRGYDEYFGIDILKTALRQAKQRSPFANLRWGDVCQLPYTNEQFDIVFCSDVLEHIPDYSLAIQEMKRVTKKGGSLIIVVPNETLWTLARFLLGRKPLRVPDHINTFNDRQIIKDIDWRVATQNNLPFYLPFNLSLCTAIKCIKS